MSVGVPGPAHAQLEEAGRPGGGKLHRNNLSMGEEGTDILLKRQQEEGQKDRKPGLS